MSKPISNPIERFWSKIDKTDTCWLWRSGVISTGYGLFFVHKGNRQLAHRYSFELANGTIPDGMVIDHICHTERCVNPKHLRAASQKQNCENKAGPNCNNRSSGIRGVTWDKSRNLWSTMVMHNGKNHSAGRFEDLDAASSAVVKLRNTLHSHNDYDRSV